jgi:hypothetical protein
VKLVKLIIRLFRKIEDEITRTNKLREPTSYANQQARQNKPIAGQDRSTASAACQTFTLRGINSSIQQTEKLGELALVNNDSESSHNQDTDSKHPYPSTAVVQFLPSEKKLGVAAIEYEGDMHLI